jgi:hypothetical protein
MDVLICIKTARVNRRLTMIWMCVLEQIRPASIISRSTLSWPLRLSAHILEEPAHGIELCAETCPVFRRFIACL